MFFANSLILVLWRQTEYMHYNIDVIKYCEAYMVEDNTLLLDIVRDVEACVENPAC